MNPPLARGQVRNDTDKRGPSPQRGADGSYHMSDEKTARGGRREGSGRKAKAASGELMKIHPMRWTDAGWADVLLIGTDRVRELVAKEAAKVRKQQRGEG